MGDNQDNANENNSMFSLIYDETLISFALSCAITSVAFLVVDYAYYIAQGKRKSLLNITYRKNNIFVILITWFGGAFVVGYFATFISIFAVSRLSMLSLGILWPLAMGKIIAVARGHLEDEDVEGTDGGDEE